MKAIYSINLFSNTWSMLKIVCYLIGFIKKQMSIWSSITHVIRIKFLLITKGELNFASASYFEKLFTARCPATSPTPIILKVSISIQNWTTTSVLALYFRKATRNMEQESTQAYATTSMNNSFFQGIFKTRKIG